MLVIFWISVLRLNHNMWGNKLLGGGLRSPSAFLVLKRFHQPGGEHQEGECGQKEAL